MELNRVADDLIRQEYLRRFYIKPGARLGSARESVDHLISIFSEAPRDQEHFLVVLLNQQHQIIASEILFSGTLASSAVYPRELVKKVIQSESAALIIGHNHPSGSVEPSQSDRAITRKIKNAMDCIDVALLDHVIIGNGSDSYYSFADNNLL
jgi:DNA repair protein RadC